MCAQDATVRYHLLHTSEKGPIDSDLTLPVEINLAAKGVEGEGESGAVPPSMAPLEPTDPEVPKENVVSVTYWLRLLLTKTPAPGQQKPQTYWSTHPIILTPASGSDAAYSI